MGWIFVDKSSGGNMRQQMRRNMRSGGNYRKYTTGVSDDYEKGYRQGYKHGWEDSEDDNMEFRRSRDSDGRFD